MDKKQKAKLKQQLDYLWEDTIKTYLDSNMYLQAYFVNDKYKTDFMLLYSWYAIRERLIIGTRRLVEPTKQKDKISIYSIIDFISSKEFEASDEDKAKIQHIREYFDILLKSEPFKRVRKIRNAFCHNLANSDQTVCFNRDILNLINDCLCVLTDLYAFIGEELPDFTEMKSAAREMAIIYWDNITKTIKPKTYGKYVDIFNKWQKRNFE